jgi:hypothetical protein
MMPPNASQNNNAPMRVNPQQQQQQQQRPYRVDGKPTCLWPQGTVMDLDVIITDSSIPPNGWTLTTPTNNDHSNSQNTEPKANPRRTKVSLKQTKDTKPLASWRQENLILGGLPSHHSKTPSIFSAFGSSSHQEMNFRNATLNISLTEALWNNETHLYAHVRLMRRVYRGQQHTSLQEHTLRKEDVLIKRVELTRHRKRKKKRDEKSLLDGTSDTKISQSIAKLNDKSVLSLASQNTTHDQILLYLKPSLSLQMVDLGTAIEFPNRQSIPRQFADHMDWLDDIENGVALNVGNGAHRGGGGGTMYYPILYVSEFWITYESLKEVNGGLKESKIDVTYEPVPVSNAGSISVAHHLIKHSA